MSDTHAPYAILGDMSIAVGRTVKTACGRRRAWSAVVSRDHATCPKCRTAIASDRQEMDDMAMSAAALGLIEEIPPVTPPSVLTVERTPDGVAVVLRRF